jgi:hypothetical protein
MLKVYEEIISSERWKWSQDHLHKGTEYEQTYLYLFASMELIFYNIKILKNIKMTVCI